MDIMKDLYRGLIKPMEDFGYSTDQIYLELVADTQKIEDGLLAGLDEKEQKVYQTIKQSNITLLQMELERMFDYAFRMGSRFGAEIFKDE